MDISQVRYLWQKKLPYNWTNITKYFTKFYNKKFKFLIWNDYIFVYLLCYDRLKDNLTLFVLMCSHKKLVVFICLPLIYLQPKANPPPNLLTLPLTTPITPCWLTNLPIRGVILATHSKPFFDYKIASFFCYQSEGFFKGFNFRTSKIKFCSILFSVQYTLWKILVILSLK